MKMKTSLLFSIALVTILGCSSRKSVLLESVAKFPLGIDSATSKKARVRFDLVGTWRVTRFDDGLQDTWQFKRLRNPLIHQWEAENNRGLFVLTDGSPKTAQALLWANTAFVICEYSFGLLHLIDAENGQRYLAVRSDGPQGDDAVYIKYQGEHP